MSNVSSDLLDSRIRAALEVEVEKLAKSSGGGDNRDMSLWQQSVETRFTQIFDELREIRKEMSSNLKWMIGVFIAGYSGVMFALAKGFGWI